MTTAAPAPARPLSVSAAAAYLGISTRSLRRTMAADLIAFVKPPYGPVTFRAQDLDEFLARFHREAGEPWQANRRLQLIRDEPALVALARKRVEARRAARGRA